MSDRGGSDTEPHLHPDTAGTETQNVPIQKETPTQSSQDQMDNQGNPEVVCIPDEEKRVHVTELPALQAPGHNGRQPGSSLRQATDESVDMSMGMPAPLSPLDSNVARVPLTTTHSLPNQSPPAQHTLPEREAFALPEMNEGNEASETSLSMNLPLTLALSSPIVAGPPSQLFDQPNQPSGDLKSIAGSPGKTDLPSVTNESIDQSSRSSENGSENSSSSSSSSSCSSSNSSTNCSHFNTSFNSSNISAVNLSQNRGVDRLTPVTNTNASGSISQTRTRHAGSCDSGVAPSLAPPEIIAAAPNTTTPRIAEPSVHPAHMRSSSVVTGGPSDVPSLIQSTMAGVSGRSSSSHMSNTSSNSCLSSSMGHRSSITSVGRFTSQDLFGGPKPVEPGAYFFSIPAPLFAQGLVDSLEGIAIRVLSYLTIKELLRLRRASSRFRDLVALTFDRLRVVNLDQFWAKLGLRHNPSVMRLASSFRSCTSLSLNYCNQVKEAFLLELLDAIFPTPERKLELRQLRLYYCFLLTDSTIQAICRRFPRLRLLDIGSCRLLTDRGCASALASLPELNYLCVTGTAVAGPALFQALIKDPGVSAANAATLAFNRFTFLPSIAGRRMEQKNIDFEASEAFPSDSSAVLNRTGSGLPSSLDTTSTPAAASAAPNIGSAASQPAGRGISHTIQHGHQPSRGHAHSQSVDQRSFRALAGSTAFQSNISPQSVPSGAGINPAQGSVKADANANAPEDECENASEDGAVSQRCQVVPEADGVQNQLESETKVETKVDTPETKTMDGNEDTDLPRAAITDESRVQSTAPTVVDTVAGAEAAESLRGTDDSAPVMVSNSLESASLPNTLDVKPALMAATDNDALGAGPTDQRVPTTGQWNIVSAAPANDTSSRGGGGASPGRASVLDSQFGSAQSATSVGGTIPAAETAISALPDYPVPWPIPCSFPTLILLELRECHPGPARSADFDAIRQKHPRVRIHCSQYWYSNVNNALLTAATTASATAAAAAATAARITGSTSLVSSPVARSNIDIPPTTSPLSVDRRTSEPLERIEELDTSMDNIDDVPTRKDENYEGTEIDAGDANSNVSMDPDAAIAMATATAAASAHAASVHAAFTAITTVTPPLTACLPPLCLRTSVLVNPNVSTMSTTGSISGVPSGSSTSGLSGPTSALSFAGSKLPPLALNASPSLSNPAGSHLAALTSGPDSDVSRAASSAQSLGVDPVMIGKGALPASAPARAQLSLGPASPRMSATSAASPGRRERTLGDVSSAAQSRPMQPLDVLPTADGSGYTSPTASTTSVTSVPTSVVSAGGSGMKTPVTSQGSISSMSLHTGAGNQGVSQRLSPGGTTTRELTQVAEEDESTAEPQDDIVHANTSAHDGSSNAEPVDTPKSSVVAVQDETTSDSVVYNMSEGADQPKKEEVNQA